MGRRHGGPGEVRSCVHAICPVHRCPLRATATYVGPLCSLRSSWPLPLVAIPATAAAERARHGMGPRSRPGSGRRTARPGAQPPDPGTSIAGLQGAAAGDHPVRGHPLHRRPDHRRGRRRRHPDPRRPATVNTVTDTGREQLAVVVNALETPDQQRDFARWTADPGAHDDRSRRRPGPAGVVRRGRQDADLHRGQHPRRRARRRRRDAPGPPRPGHDAVRRRTPPSTTCSITRSCRHPQPEPGRALPRHAGEQQRVRHEPRPARPVAAGDPGQHPRSSRSGSRRSCWRCTATSTRPSSTA